MRFVEFERYAMAEKHEVTSRRMTVFEGGVKVEVPVVDHVTVCWDQDEDRLDEQRV